MNERLVRVASMRDIPIGSEYIQTEIGRFRRATGAYCPLISAEETLDLVVTDPELPTTPGAVIWAEDESGAPGARAYELHTGRGGFGWYATGRLEPVPERIFTRVHAVLRDPGADT